MSDDERLRVGVILSEGIDSVAAMMRLMGRWYGAQAAIAMSAEATPGQRELMPYLTAAFNALDTEIRQSLDAVERQSAAGDDVEDESIQGIPDQALEHWPDIFGEQQ